ncbi:hypothetical protein DFP92_114101 [Yoonia sediminilitoris]|uniref:Uncharacterized protein n=1 Tax=Yoonia sediminilitoris TaxID=1286148 RepID=A0A2T6K976_9RHOB|nr:hypothetical protein C8N45_114100 [Yoonia sediminilitoris]RCW91142.1 hypothetical protein DFP92_114101 [Yoonia sediminilitoris]
MTTHPTRRQIVRLICFVVAFIKPTATLAQPSMSYFDVEVDRDHSLRTCMNAAEDGNYIGKDGNFHVFVYDGQFFRIDIRARAMGCFSFRPTGRRN